MPVFFADVFEGFMAVVMVFVALAGYVGQFMKNKQQGAQRRAQGGNDPNVQSEIDRFLQEVTGQKPAAPERRPAQEREPARQQRRAPEQERPQPPRRETPRRRPAELRDDDFVEVIEEPTPKPRRQAKKKRQPSRQTAQALSPTPTASSTTQGVGAMSSREQYVPPRRTASRASGPRDLVTTLGPSLASELRDPATIRKAIVLNMILSKPRSLEGKDAL